MAIRSMKLKYLRVSVSHAVVFISLVCFSVRLTEIRVDGNSSCCLPNAASNAVMFIKLECLTVRLIEVLVDGHRSCCMAVFCSAFFIIVIYCMHVSATDRSTDGVWGRITRPHQHQELRAPITLLPLRQTRRLWGASVRRCKGGPGEPMSRPARHPSSCGGLERSRHRASLLWGDSGGRAVAAEPCDCCEGCGGCFEGWRPTQDSGGAGCYHLWTDHHTNHSGPGSCQGEWRLVSTAVSVEILACCRNLDLS